jgi:glycosyltransferase involved in cell wall biosynthesis
MKATAKKIPITAFIVTFNEENNIHACLESISFCEEIIVVDIGSTDRTLELVSKHDVKLFHHEWVPFAEFIQSQIGKYTANKWILIPDPDEVTSPALAEFITDRHRDFMDNIEIGEVRAPIQYYVGDVKLSGTVWGEHNKRSYIVHLDRFRFASNVHSGRKLAPGFKQFVIERTPDIFIHHYWAESFRELQQKFFGKYLKHEGESRYATNRVPKLSDIVVAPFRIFYVSFVSYKGVKDGFLGLKLSIFYSLYQTRAMWEAYKYSRRMLKTKKG